MKTSPTDALIRTGAALTVLLCVSPVARADDPRDRLNRCQPAAPESFVCAQPYALCTSAPCIPDPDDPENQAICMCTVEDGYSVGQTSCAKRAMKKIVLTYAAEPETQVTQHPPPKPDPVESTTVLLTSTFSLKAFATDTTGILLCEAGNPWTDCLDAPCTVDQLNPEVAICRCPILRQAAFVTFGGECDVSTCENSYWSAATIPSMCGSMPVLNEVLGTRVLWDESICSGQLELLRDYMCSEQYVEHDVCQDNKDRICYVSGSEER